ncbi:sodium-dependent transporter [Shouchella lonarensis]|uniref:Neurotransmitter:Na+ symporter, NSS family n=1 Tax=Shouchella lonarensis TaxID=1464122 RepID=A0A1G6H9Q1_9BACI|nr:sodium-dependent transporter [Shouchella lonarensis]SDB90818.1 neurotransmitter:Na+ symporter, NSS family [Shouchella lonarensis]
MGRQQWSSKLGFILAAAGSAVGLGAIWQFPYVTGVSGGGAFFLIFIFFTLLVALPLLIGEFVIGRSTQKNAVESYREIAPSKPWYLIGKLGMVTCFLLLSFYSVVGGWILIYIWKTATGALVHLGTEEYGPLFAKTIENPVVMVGAHLLFMVLVMFVISRGVQKGIERASVWLMPGLFVLFLVIVIRSLTLEGAMEGVAFFLQPNFSSITPEVILFAMGQSFFMLSVGTSVMVTYSSYLDKKANLVQSGLSIVGMNFFVALLAGLAIFPAVFSVGMDPAQGETLLFVTLPAVFDQLPFGMFFLLIFLILFLFAALTSAFSMLEIIVAVRSNGDDRKRSKVTWTVGLLIFLVGVPSALSFGVWKDVLIFDKNIFGAVAFLVSNILLPIGVLLIAVFVPLKMSRQVLMDELIKGKYFGKKLFICWLLLLKYVVPIAIVLVFLSVIGVFDLLF